MMNKIATVSAVLAVASASPFANTTSTVASPSASCQAQFDACRSTGDPNEAFCAAQSASCFGSIPSATASVLSPSASCSALYNSCLTSGDPNLAACAASSASCFGSIPSATAGPVVYTTEVVTAYTTYCPAATTFTQGTKTYTVTSATTLTITDCPCTVTRPIPHPTAPVYTNGTQPAIKPTTVAVGQPVYITSQPGAKATTIDVGQPLYFSTQTGAQSASVAVGQPLYFSSQPGTKPTTVAVGQPVYIPSAPAAQPTVQASKSAATAAPSHTIITGAAGKVVGGIQAAMVAAAAALLV